MENSLNGKFTEAYKLLTEELESWFEVAIKALPNLVVAILVLLVFAGIAKLARKLIKKLSKKIVDNEAVTGLLETLTQFIVMAVGVFMALGILNLDKTVTSLLAGAGVIGLALGFAFQEIASNFVSGILIAFREPYKLGDIIEIDGHQGTVTKIELRTTSITTFQGLEVIIPNKRMFTETFTNYTTTPRRRIDLEVGVSYGDKLDEAVDVTKKALEGIDGRLESEEVQIYFTEFGSSSINFVAHIWIPYPANPNFLEVRHKAIMAIKSAFEENDLTIPYPIRTLDFGIKGGQPLHTQL
ncbi:MAG: mechanosensitive ion channel protein MscS [Bdellovibrionaceae bacterium]|nr:mechanosensitive ion channel protein MscS [Pseudobdellovibrionaceae bacterium]